MPGSGNRALFNKWRRFLERKFEPSSKHSSKFQNRRRPGRLTHSMTPYLDSPDTESINHPAYVSEPYEVSRSYGYTGEMHDFLTHPSWFNQGTYQQRVPAVISAPPMYNFGSNQTSPNEYIDYMTPPPDTYTLKLQGYSALYGSTPHNPFPIFPHQDHMGHEINTQPMTVSTASECYNFSNSYEPKFQASLPMTPPDDFNFMLPPHAYSYPEFKARNEYPNHDQLFLSTNNGFHYESPFYN